MFWTYLGALADDEDVSQTGGELAVHAVANVGDVETTQVALLGEEDAGSAHVTSASAHADVSWFKLDVGFNLTAKAW